jgi:peptidoglycan hydrolase CwlO-like protein
MPKHGDSLFSIEGGKLKRVIFIEESLSAPECTETTYVLRNLNSQSRFRCSKDMYVATSEQAWQRYLDQLQQALPDAEKAVINAQNQLNWLKNKILETQAILTPTKKENS